MTIGFFSAAREDALRHACVCMRATCTSQCEHAHRARAHSRVSMYARLVGLGSEVKRRD